MIYSICFSGTNPFMHIRHTQDCCGHQVQRWRSTGVQPSPYDNDVYAAEVCNSSRCCLCVASCPALIVQGVEKTIVSKMLVEGSNRRTYAVDRHAGVVSAAPAAAAAAAAVSCWEGRGSHPGSDEAVLTTAGRGWSRSRRAAGCEQDHLRGAAIQKVVPCRYQCQTAATCPACHAF
jgi:hypothetical protein